MTFLTDSHCIWDGVPLPPKYRGGEEKQTCNKRCLANNRNFKIRLGELENSSDQKNVVFTQKCYKLLDDGVTAKHINEQLKAYNKGIITNPKKIEIPALSI
ncbi:MAG: hypothetical protein IIB02_06735 [Thaumarchaeota archaeon]|nr:hypothetical protein [Nitrososphaerota archaeon]